MGDGERRAVRLPVTRELSEEVQQRLRVMWGSDALVQETQEMREHLARMRSERVDPLTITNPEMLEHRGIRAGDIILTPDGTRAVAQRDYMLVEAGVEPSEVPHG